MGAPHYTVALQKIAAEQGLTVLHAAQDYATREIRTADVNRPGLQLAGFYNYFDPERLQIIGRVESTYLETLTPDQRRERFEQFMRYNIIGLVICHGMDPFPECLEMAEKYDRNLFLVRKDTSEFMADLIASLSGYLAPRLTQHGVLVEVFGEGVLITGDSGVGKSETALELIKRGHRLVADDAVEIKRVNRTTLMGSAPEMIRYYMELRGIGVIDARRIYGVGAVKPETRVDLVVQLEPWEDGKAYACAMQYIGKRDSLDKARQGVSVAELEKRYRTANETALREAGLRYRIWIATLACLLLAAAVTGAVVGYRRKLRHRDAQLSEYLTLLESYRESHDSLTSRLDASNEREAAVKASLEGRFALLRDIAATYYTYGEGERLARKVKELALSPAMLADIVRMADLYNDRAVTRLRRQLPGWTPRNYDFAALVVAGFSAQEISVMLDMTLNGVYTLKSKLKRRIAESGAADREFFTRFFA